MFFFSSKKNKQKNRIEPQLLPPKIEVDWKEKNPNDFLSMLIEAKSRVKAILIDVTALKNPKSISLINKVLEDGTMEYVHNANGRVFELINKSILFVFKDNYEDEIQALLIRLQFTFNDEMVAANKSNILETDFVKIYATNEQLKELKYKIISFTATQVPENKSNQDRLKIPGILANVLSTNKRKMRPLTPDVLDKMQKSLLRVDFSSLIRRQAVCAVIGKSAPQMIFEEVYVSIPDLRDILLPDVDFTSNPWLFMHLTETLDKRVLAHISKHDDGSLVSNFSMNLNVSTILSDEFLEFDESIPPQMRSSIVLELQLVDIFNDVKAFLLAKSFAQYRGYKICIDGITVDKLQYINRENLNSDLMKIIWHPSFLDIINEDKHFRDYVNKAERAKMILCRVDDAKAIEIGNSIGINLYQGRYVQAELNRRRK